MYWIGLGLEKWTRVQLGADSDTASNFSRSSARRFSQL